MSFAGMSLVEVAATVATRLRTRGIEVVVVGGSATPVGHVRVLHLEDAIADRIAAFLHWSDSESLDAAERSIIAARDHLLWERVDAALRKLDTKLPQREQRMTLARERLRRAIAGQSD